MHPDRRRFANAPTLVCLGATVLTLLLVLLSPYARDELSKAWWPYFWIISPYVALGALGAWTGNEKAASWSSLVGAIVASAVGAVLMIFVLKIDALAAADTGQAGTAMAFGFVVLFVPAFQWGVAGLTALVALGIMRASHSSSDGVV
jgi:hypothetical protein